MGFSHWTMASDTQFAIKQMMYSQDSYFGPCLKCWCCYHIEIINFKQGTAMKWTICAFTALTLLSGCGSQAQYQEAEPTANGAASDDGKLWVTSEGLDRHSCPKESCGVVGKLSFREAATPLEEHEGWVRITKWYDGACEDGQSRYVETGNRHCTLANGFQEGTLSEWVRKESLSAARPADPAATASADETLVAQSDDFTRYRRQFVFIASKLISDGRCTRAEFEEQGGFFKSVTEHRNEPVYFIYCGGMTVGNKIYVNAKNGSIM
jgi:hypothetical protein